MNRLKSYILITLTVSIFCFCSCSSDRSNRNSFVLIKTTLGDITVRLYDETPVHRDNFLKLVNSNFYNNILFHRVIKDFMIQGGDPLTSPGFKAGTGAADTLQTYTLPAEFNPALFHKKGALAAAREGNDVNPEMRSSGTQFYIVQGKKYSDEELVQAEQRMNNNIKQALFSKLLKEVGDSARLSGNNLKDSEIQEKASLKMFEILDKKGDYRIPENQRVIYKTIGGVQRLDGTYTVFGEVVKGLEVVDNIASTQTDEKDKPVTDIRILKMKRVRK
jgi:peptidylprolyl isomerase